ncbi:hypothetical protein [Actinoplanes sp. ATCC 53533]|uniref:hypothetical protein n=1 Tax=Actinoplanes sp. ATCC 53533 TaxID=1288362 RepID=UPI00131569D2|nr:hypothetical protein [Actinoplanes sp. ATCC 53533]
MALHTAGLWRWDRGKASAGPAEGPARAHLRAMATRFKITHDLAADFMWAAYHGK